MAEYIISPGSNIQVKYQNGKFDIMFEADSTEEIIRCKDCKDCYPFSAGGYFCSTTKEFKETSLDGYCAWGVKRDG